MYTLEQIQQLLKEGKIDLQQAQAMIASSPEQQARIQELQAAQKRGEQVAVSAEVLDLLKNIGYMGFSQGQIGKANRMAPTIPQLPQVPGLSPELTEAIYQAQRGVSAMPALEASRQGIEDAYTGALNRGEAASGGQAGAYQAMAQLANIERLKAQLGLAPIAQEISMQNAGNLNNLLGARVDERQQQYLNGLYGSQIAFDQYNRAAEAVGGLGSAGNTNALDAAGRITQNLQGLTPYYRKPQRESLQDWYNSQVVGFDPDTQNYMNQVRMENGTNFSFNPPPQDDGWVNNFRMSQIGPSDPRLRIQ